MDHSIGKKVFRGTLIIMLVGVAAKLAAFISEVVLAACLGANYRSDAYYMVSNIQAVLYPTLGVGVWKVFLPLYKERCASGRIQEANELTNRAISFFSVVSFGAVLLLILLAGPVVSLLAPGFEGETRALCVRLVRLSAPMYFFIIAAAIYATILQAHDKFFGSQIREVASHIPTILAALFCYQKWGVEAMAIALVAGGLVRLLVELPFVDWGYRFRPDFRFRNPEFSLLLKRLPSALASEGVVQLNALIDKAMASTLPEGTISGLNYGHKLMSVFNGLLSGAITTALFPQTVELIAKKRIDELGRMIARIVNLFCLIMVPVSLACVLFRKELVTAVFQHGSFAADSTALTADVFALYCLGLFFLASNSVVSNVFYGFGDTKTPMVVSVIGLAVNVALNVALVQLWGVNGLALATSVSAIVTFLVRLLMVKRYVRLDYGRMLVTFLKVSLASAVGCFVPRILFWLLPANPWLLLAASALIGAVLFFAALRLLRVKELDDLAGMIKRWLNKTKSEEKPQDF
ncbi:MAG: murein biosynthesis integral membrane protein MurJ [Oscillospiraceae bacterium]|nr:murein biosynthesis integral membrane protein MurJ [Oscillospiraceae bacterium]